MVGGTAVRMAAGADCTADQGDLVLLGFELVAGRGDAGLFDDAPPAWKPGQDRCRSSHRRKEPNRPCACHPRAITPSRQAWRPYRIRPANEGLDSSRRCIARRLRNSAQSRQTATSGCSPSRTTCSSGKDDPQHPHSTEPSIHRILDRWHPKVAFLRGPGSSTSTKYRGSVKSECVTLPECHLSLLPWVLSMPTRESRAQGQNRYPVVPPVRLR